MCSQDLDPNEVYKEDYEEDIIQNQGLKTGYNDNYNNQYQTPYYSYQEDYFNEEDEYKYLEEEEREEEAANLEHQRKQSTQSIHDQHNLQHNLQEMNGYGRHMQPRDKLDEIDDHEVIEESVIEREIKHDQDLDGMAGGYQSDEDSTLDDNKLKNQISMNKQNKKRHLTTQESISDSEFFSQRFDGPGLKNLNKQESIIEEEETTTTYPVAEDSSYPKSVLSRVQASGGVSIYFYCC